MEKLSNYYFLHDNLGQLSVEMVVIVIAMLVWLPSLYGAGSGLLPT